MEIVKISYGCCKTNCENAFAYYQDGDETSTKKHSNTYAFLNSMTLDIAMGGSTNTVLHLLAIAHEAEVNFTMEDIDQLSRKTPCLCKVAPNTTKYHIQDVNRAGGFRILNELQRRLLHTEAKRVDGMTEEKLLRHMTYAQEIFQTMQNAYIQVLRINSIWN